MVIFVYVCLEVANFFMMFTCRDYVQPVRYGVCNVYVGCEGWFVQVVPSFASWSLILLSKIPMYIVTFCIIMLCLVCRNWCTMAEINNLSKWLCLDERWRM